MANKTISFSEAAKGWPSFYSFFPDKMEGMNNMFYTWKGGNLYKHNSDLVNRQQFYGVDYSFSVKTVLNEFPLDNKLFKTIAIIGNSPWDILSMETDLQSGGNIDSSWFEEKESSWFAYVRNASAIPADISEYPLRSLNGIGRSLTVTGAGAAVNINFAIPTVAIGSILSIGDYLYYSLPPSYSTPILAGLITNVQVDYPNGVNRIVVNTSVTGGNLPPIGTAYFLFIKNQIAESHGLTGKFLVVEMENDSTIKTELFVIEADVMTSFPKNSQ